MRDNLSSSLVLISALIITLLFIKDIIREGNNTEKEYIKNGYEQCIVSNRIIWSKKCQ